MKNNLLKNKYPELLNEWDYEKNNAIGIDANVITCCSHVRAWWLCSKYGHSYEAIISNRTRGRGCPYCTGQKVLRGFNDLQSQCPELIKEWDWTRNDDKNLKPYAITKGSKSKSMVCMRKMQ